MIDLTKQSPEDAVMQLEDEINFDESLSDHDRNFKRQQVSELQFMIKKFEEENMY